ncbi:hypothetical protein D3X40_26410 (plasmid) [Klebsiella quasipneumoniae]|nr:hypothetical protein D3X40_26410 [Klebsiella quasipneumoniae]
MKIFLPSGFFTPFCWWYYFLLDVIPVQDIYYLFVASLIQIRFLPVPDLLQPRRGAAARKHNI